MLTAPVTANDHIRGNTSALMTLLEYGDYECPYCRRAHTVTKHVQKHFGDQLKFVYRHFPLTQVHPYAEEAAETAEFADAQNCFWQMHDLLYEYPNGLNTSIFFQLAKTLDLSIAALQEVLENKLYQSRIQSHFLSGVRSGVNGTPTFFINGERYNGSWDFANLITAIDESTARSL